MIFQHNLDIHMFGSPLVGTLGGETLWAHQLKGDLDTLLTTRGQRDHLGGWASAMKLFEGKAIVCTNSVGGDPEATDYLALIDLIVKRVSSAF